MSLGNPASGFNSVAAYAIAGVPYVVNGTATTTATLLAFPYVTRAITINNTSASTVFLYAGFTQNGVTTGVNCIAIDGGKSLRFEVRVRDLWLKAASTNANYSVLAELTSITRANCLPLTGSAPTGWQEGSYLLWEGVG